MKKVMFISSEGGHFDEMQQLDFKKYNYSIVTEKTSSTKGFKKIYNKKIHYLLYGTRKTPVRYAFIFIINIFISLYLFFRIRPNVIVTTGTHTAVPMCYIGRLFGRKIIWIETFANKESKTLAGKLVYPIANTFVVQWEEMKKLYPKAEYWGCIY